MDEKKLSVKNYIGYAMCEISNTLSFSAVSRFLSAYYTDIVKLSGTSATLIMILARIWDAINDPMMGVVAQKAKPTKFGKYRHFILLGGIPYAVATFLVFTTPGTDSYIFKFIWAILTYIFCGMAYTVVLVPYGSLANVMTRNPLERSNLSVFRSIGGGFGSAPCGIIFPMLVFTDNALDGNKLFKTMLVVSAIMVAIYFFSFSTTQEYVPPVENPEKIRFKEIFSSLIKDRSFVIISIIGCLLIASSMYLGSAAVYVFKDYFKQTGLIMTMFTVFTYAPMALMIPFTSLIIKKVGKKEFSVIGLAISVVSSLTLCFWKVTNPWIFILFVALINLGVGFVTLEIWAFAGDVIDLHELKTKRREEAASFACFTFMRKIGQAIAGCVPFLLQLIGYDKNNVGNQLPEVCDGIYKVTTIGPAVMFIIMLICFILYPMTKQRSQDVSVELKALRAQMDASSNQ